ncbi:MAG: DUF349 domain-containing protein [Bacteroidia bacterium]|nr:DUF349 domain-containing protein [Bacteroidia bacterium]
MMNPELENGEQKNPDVSLSPKNEVPLVQDAEAPSEQKAEPVADESIEAISEHKTELPIDDIKEDSVNQEAENAVVNEPVKESPVDETTKISSEETTAPVDLKPAEVPELNNEQVENIVLNEDESELDSVEDLPDFANLSKEDLLKTVLKATAEKELSEALQIFKAIKPFFDHHISEEKELALSKYLEEGGDKDNFEYKGDGSREQFNQAFSELKQRKEETRKRQEAEKLENLKKKEAILDEIKKLNDSEETENSLRRIKELQSEWKKIKNVPKEQLENLWESYRVLNEIFYDRLSINNELKELDRSKNLDQKIELISRLSELTGETNIKKALISVKRIQEEWRYIGPVPKEASDGIWSRFKAEGDKVFGFIKQKTEEMELVRQQNLLLKQELLAKASEIAQTKTNRIKEWMDKSNASNELMEAWKKIGHVPMAMRDQIWNEFRDARNTFYTNKNNYFKVLHTERNANLKAKEALCIKAETISANPIDWNKQTDELKKMQEDWKKIGQAPDKVNDAVWKRFRTACDSFFTQKSERYAIQQQEQLQNLESKNGLIEKLEKMLTAESSQNVFAELKQIQSDWNALGYVPAQQKDAVIRKYNDLLDKLYSKHKQLNKEVRNDRDQQNFEYLASSPNGMQKLQREEKILMERIKGLKKDIDTWDNNLGFFKMGNSKNPLAEQIHSKIELANKLIDSLEEKLKALKALRNKPSEPINQ